MQTHTTIKRTLDARNLAATLELLEQCQNCAIGLGEKIEAMEGEGFPTISLLENYCEVLYQIYEKVLQSAGINSNQVHNTLAKELIRIGNSIKNDIHIRSEAVFLPYKASMWDSLESIWKAADEDPDCDAYVIPIPYYDKKPDGSFGEMHYEGDQYPDYVPITDYKTYDFADRRPDLIFIHNPYDNNNFVTSVMPCFYSNNLKQFTDKLVYVSYFILGDIDPENEEAVNGISHFCTTPGVINADKVIVQSENMKKAYVRALTKAAGEASRKYWEEKILGLGSPKTDKVMNTRKEDVAVPEEWKRIIEKPDGSWRKVVFYNTSVSALLQNDEKMLAKIRDVLRVFHENRDEVTLLWRPHPLMEATIKAMRPGLWEEYEGIVDRYRSDRWGIYDDTADLDRAIALSDGYYRDWSSVVELCKEKGIPVMIQNVEV